MKPKIMIRFFKTLISQSHIGKSKTVYHENQKNSIYPLFFEFESEK